MNKSSRCTQKALDKQIKDNKSLESRILRVQQTLNELHNTPPALGSKWTSGMIRYYSGVLAELESLRDNVS